LNSTAGKGVKGPKGQPGARGPQGPKGPPGNPAPTLGSFGIPGPQVNYSSLLSKYILDRSIMLAAY